MSQEVLTKNGRRFVAATKKGANTVYIGTVGINITNVLAQIFCHEVMKPLKWATSGTFEELALDGETCTGVGYTIPEEAQDNPLNYLKSIF